MSTVSDKEINDLLAEIASGKNLTKEQIEEIQRKELEDLKSDNIEGITSADAWGYAVNVNRETEIPITKFEPALRSVARAKSKENAKETVKIKAANRKKNEELINEILKSDDIDLQQLVTVEDKQKIIYALTKNYTDMMERHAAYINKTIESALKRCIPNDLLKVFEKYKDSVVLFPGFEYKASEDYGEGKTFWVEPHVPYYFSQSVCQKLLDERIPNLNRLAIDKAVAMFYKNKDTRSKMEVKLAMDLTHISTYYQLLKKKPKWFLIIKGHGNDDNL